MVVVAFAFWGCLEQGWQTFSAKGPAVSTPSFAGHHGLCCNFSTVSFWGKPPETTHEGTGLGVFPVTKTQRAGFGTLAILCQLLI